MCRQCCILIAAYLVSALGLDNGLALTPPMGWCTWERFQCATDCVKHPTGCINEALILAQADQLVNSGFRDAGYVYVNIDDCWQSRSRDVSGRLQSDPARFPHGMKWMANQMHQRGLKLGLYTDYGIATCSGFPGSPWDRQQIDAETFAEWGIDYLKVDGCNSDVQAHTPSEGFPRFGQFLNQTGHPIVYSCSWADYAGGQADLAKVAKTCNMWRTNRDIYANGYIIRDIIHSMGHGQSSLQPIAGPGAWNDPDELVVGDHHKAAGGLSHVESQTTMAMWAIWASPLLMSNDLRNLSAFDRAILLNREVIAVNQDKLGIQGTRIVDYNLSNVIRCRTAQSCSTSDSSLADGAEIWARPLLGGDIALVMYNRNAWHARDITLDLADVGAFNRTSFRSMSVYDLFSGVHSTAVDTVLASAVPPRGCRMFRIAPTTTSLRLYSAQESAIAAAPLTSSRMVLGMFAVLALGFSGGCAVFYRTGHSDVSRVSLIESDAITVEMGGAAKATPID